MVTGLSLGVRTANSLSALVALMIIGASGVVISSPSAVPLVHNPVARGVIPFPADNSTSVGTSSTNATTSSKTTTSTSTGNSSTTTTSTSSTATVPALVVLNATDGATVCPEYLSGPGVSSTNWDAPASVCTVLASPSAEPAVCISNSPGGCTGAAADRFVIDSGVTVSFESQGNVQAALCVYSTLVNNGTVEGATICDYGTIINYGKIDIPVGGFFQTLPYNGFGVLDNMKGGVVLNNYDFVDLGTVINSGTIHNRGQFGNDNQPSGGTFVNTGTFIGSAPCFSYNSCRTWLGIYNISASGTTVDQTSGTGISLTITGASGKNVGVISQNQTTAAPMGLGSLNVSSALFFDVLVNGISTGNARVCVTNGYVVPGMAGGMQYWNGTAWTFAANQNVSSRTLVIPPGPNQTATITRVYNSLCGDVPVMALNGTPMGFGSPLSVSRTTSTSTSSQTPPASSSQQTRTTTSPSSQTSSLSSASSTTSSLTTEVTSSPTGFWTGLAANQLYIGIAVVLSVVVLALAIVLRRRGRGPP